MRYAPPLLHAAVQCLARQALRLAGSSWLQVQSMSAPLTHAFFARLPVM